YRQRSPAHLLETTHRSRADASTRTENRCTCIGVEITAPLRPVFSVQAALALAALLLTGCGAARYYGGVIIPEGHLSDQARARLLTQLPAKLRESQPTRIEVSSAGGML